MKRLNIREIIRSERKKEEMKTEGGKKSDRRADFGEVIIYELVV